MFTAEIMQADRFTLVWNSQNSRIPQEADKECIFDEHKEIILEICNKLWNLELHKI